MFRQVFIYVPKTIEKEFCPKKWVYHLLTCNQSYTVSTSYMVVCGSVETVRHTVEGLWLYAVRLCIISINPYKQSQKLDVL